MHGVLRRTLPAAFANSKRTMSMTTRLHSDFGSLWPIFGHSGSIFGPGFRSLGSIFGPSDIRGAAPNVKKHFLCHTALSVVQMQQVPLYCTTNDEETHFLDPSDHNSFPHQVQSFSKRSPPVASILFQVAKCLSTATSAISLAQERHLKNHSF